MTSGLKLVVFDVDGTLIDSQEMILAAMHQAFEGRGELPSRAQVLSIVGLSLPQAMARLAPDMSEAGQGELVEAYRAAFLEMRRRNAGEDAAPLYPGARDAIEALHAVDEILLGVATGKAKRGLDHMLKAHALEPYFVTRQTADDHPSKPHPSMLTTALAETGCEAVDAVMIGDTTFDIEMGRAAGMQTVGVAWGYHTPEVLSAAGATRIIDTFAALPAAIHEMLRM